MSFSVQLTGEGWEGGREGGRRREGIRPAQSPGNPMNNHGASNYRQNASEMIQLKRGVIPCCSKGSPATCRSVWQGGGGGGGVEEVEEEGNRYWLNLFRRIGK